MAPAADPRSFSWGTGGRKLRGFTRRDRTGQSSCPGSLQWQQLFAVPKQEHSGTFFLGIIIYEALISPFHWLQRWVLLASSDRNRTTGLRSPQRPAGSRRRGQESPPDLIPPLNWTSFSNQPVQDSLPSWAMLRGDARTRRGVRFPSRTLRFTTQSFIFGYLEGAYTQNNPGLASPRTRNPQPHQPARLWL